MVAIRWKVKPFLRKYFTKTQLKRLAVLLLVLVLCYICFTLQRCLKIWVSDMLSWQRPIFVCMGYTGRLANQMFQYAFAYSIARKTDNMLILDRDNELSDVFEIKQNPWELYGFNSNTCLCFWKREASLDCGYDNKFEDMHPGEDLSFNGFFQSWVYWKKYERELRNKFTFKSEIKLLAFNKLKDILKASDISVLDTTIVGIHIRRGDYEDPHFIKFGYHVVPDTYLINAMNYFKGHFKKIFFVVCSNDYQWSSDVLGKEKNVHVVQGNSAPVDMALLTMTNHTIMTVGTFGWMIGWITRGITVYYKYPYVEGSPFSKHFHKNYTDHFYPGWIGLE